MSELTVCIATYNRSQFLGDCIRSVLNNDVPPYCIHVIDNSSCKTHRLINSIIAHSFSVNYIESPTLGNLSSARNLSLSLTSTRYWTFIDDDDRWPHSYLQSLNPYLDAASSPIILTYGTDFHNPLGPLGQVTTLSTAFLLGLTPPVGMQVYNIELLPHLHYSESINSGVDHDLWISLLAINPHVVVNKSAFNILQEPSDSRITQSYHARKSNIAISLKFWQTTLVSNLGEDFYRHFCHCYIQSIDDLLYSQILKGNIRLLPYLDPVKLVSFILRYLYPDRFHGFKMFAPFSPQ